MIAIIRISGDVKIKSPVRETLNRLRLGKKYTCALIDENSAELMGMVLKVRDFIAYGKINEETLVKLLKARGKMQDKGELKGVEKIAKEILDGKKLLDIGIKPFFRLHPPRGGLKSSKKHYPKGVLGNNKEDINKLIEKML